MNIEPWVSTVFMIFIFGAVGATTFVVVSDAQKRVRRARAERRVRAEREHKEAPQPRIKGRNGSRLVFLGLLAVAAAIVFHALAGRYEVAGEKVAIRVDRLTGETCFAVYGGNYWDEGCIQGESRWWW